MDKLYGNEKMTRDDAEKVCHADEGHLVNVDSAIKVKYINEINHGVYSGARLWIDGRRTKQGVPHFTFGYKPADPSFYSEEIMSLLMEPIVYNLPQSIIE